MTLRKNIDKKAYGISQTLWDKSINFMLIFNAKGFSMTVLTAMQRDTKRGMSKSLTICALTRKGFAADLLLSVYETLKTISGIFTIALFWLPAEVK